MGAGRVGVGVWGRGRGRGRGRGGGRDRGRGRERGKQEQQQQQQSGVVRNRSGRLPAASGRGGRVAVGAEARKAAAAYGRSCARQTSTIRYPDLYHE